MYHRSVTVLALAVALAACTMGLGDKLDPRLVQSLKLQQVNVSMPADARFWWGDGERAYARSIGHSETESQTLGATAEGRNFMRALASERIKAAFDRELVGHLNGTRPVRLEVVMEDIYISSPVEQILIGASFRMKGRARLVDAKSGEVIASNDNLTTTTAGGSGIVGTMVDRGLIGDPIDRLASNLAQSYRGWLLSAN